MTLAADQKIPVDDCAQCTQEREQPWTVAHEDSLDRPGRRRAGSRAVTARVTEARGLQV